MIMISNMVRIFRKEIPNPFIRTLKKGEGKTYDDKKILFPDEGLVSGLNLVLDLKRSKYPIWLEHPISSPSSIPLALLNTVSYTLCTYIVVCIVYIVHSIYSIFI